MSWAHRRSTYYVLLLTGATLGFTLLYDYGMTVWEGRPTTLLHALEIVLQTFTTTGYGEDAPWTSPQLHVIVITMQIAGVGLILTAADVFIVPFLRDALSTTPPAQIEDISDHTVICGYTSRTAALADELDARGIEYLFVESDRETAVSLHEDGYNVIEGDPNSIETLEGASLSTARAVVTDAPDEISASIILSVRQLEDDIRIVSLVEDHRFARYQRYAGATETLSPRQLVGERLADKITTSFRSGLGELVEIGGDIEVVEVSVQRGSVIDGQTLETAALPAGVHVVGAWIDGEFVTPVPSTFQFDENTVLLVTGKRSQLERLQEQTRSPVRKHAQQDVLVIGRGQTGSAVSEALSAADVSHTVLDVEDKEGVDIVGDATDPDVLEEANIHERGTVVLVLGDDETAILASLIVQELNPTAEILARAREVENVGKLYQAGAHYVLSLSRVSGRMMASALLPDQEVIATNRQVDLVHTTAPSLSGQTLAGANVRAKTGCTVVAVQRDEEWQTAISPSFEFEEGDTLLVAGTSDSLDEFTQTFA